MELETALQLFQTNFPLWNVDRSDTKLMYREKGVWSKDKYSSRWRDHADKVIARLELPLVAIYENGGLTITSNKNSNHEHKT